NAPSECLPSGHIESCPIGVMGLNVERKSSIVRQTLIDLLPTIIHSFNGHPRSALPRAIDNADLYIQLEVSSNHFQLHVCHMITEWTRYKRVIKPLYI